MNEKPILFKGPLVVAILEGRKTQTRRIIKNPKIFLPNKVSGDFPIGHMLSAGPGCCKAKIHDAGAVSVITKDGKSLGVKPSEFQWMSPYGSAGYNLWVRETHRMAHMCEPLMMYRADGQIRNVDVPVGAETVWESGNNWRPSIFMHRWASRIDLLVCNIRVQRLQSITEYDAKAEGVESFVDMFPNSHEQRLTTGELAFDSPYRSGFAVVWDEINADRATWKSNPWVWVVDFLRHVPGGLMVF